MIKLSAYPLTLCGLLWTKDRQVEPCELWMVGHKNEARTIFHYPLLVSN